MLTLLGVAVASCLVFALQTWRRVPEKRLTTVSQQHSLIRAAQLRTEFAGCGRVLAGPTCELGGSHGLTLWTNQNQAMLSVTAQDARGDVQALAFTSTVSQEGRRLSLQVPVGSKRISLRANETPFFGLRVAEREMAPVIEAANALRKSGDAKQAKARLMAALPRLDAHDQQAALSVLARVPLSLGNYAEAKKLLGRSMRAAALSGNLSQASQDAFALSYINTALTQDFQAAQDALDAARDYTRQYPEGVAELAYYDALLLKETARYRMALERVRGCIQMARRLGLDALETDASQLLGALYTTLGRFSDALKLKRARWDRNGNDAVCDQLAYHTSIAWLALRAGTTYRERIDLAARHLDLATAALQNGCDDRFSRQNHRLNLLLYALQTGDSARVASLLEQLQSRPPTTSPLLAAWQGALVGFALVSQGKPRAALAPLQRAASSGHDEPALEALTTLGRAQTALGAFKEAAITFERATLLSRQTIGKIPFGEGRANYAQLAAAPSEHWVSLLAQRGQLDEAVAKARHQIAHANLAVSASPVKIGDDSAQWLTAISQYRKSRSNLESFLANAWQHPKSEQDRASEREAALRLRVTQALDQLLLQRPARTELPEFSGPDPSTAHLVFLRQAVLPDVSERSSSSGSDLPSNLTSRNWLLLVQTTEGTVALRVPHGKDSTPNWAKLSDTQRRLFTATIESKQRLHVYLPPSLATTNLERLSINGGALLEKHSLTHGSDLPPHSRPAPDTAHVVVGNPKGDLPSSETEARLVARRLGGSEGPWLAGAATRKQLLGALNNVSWFHFAGHGSFSGVDGASSALLLHRETLGLGDIATLRTPPRVVVLSACEGARRTGAEFRGYSVAQAFLFAGSSLVIASTRVVTDTLALKMMSAFYDDVTADAPLAKLIERFRIAQLRLMHEVPDEDWTAFKLFTR